MIRDPIIEEVRKHREEYAKRFNYDLAAICRDLRKQQKASGEKGGFAPTQTAEKSGREVEKRPKSGEPNEDMARASSLSPLGRGPG